MDWFWTKSSIRSCVASGKKIRHPSSARRSTSRSRCGEDRKMIFGINFEFSQYWSDDVWISKMAGGGGNKKRFQSCVDPSGEEILYFRALQRHSGRRPIDPTLHDNVLISNIFPVQAFCWMCTQFMLHHKFRIDSSRERQTVFLTVVNTMNKNHKDPQLIKPRLAQYKPKWKRHRDMVYWVEFQFAERKGLKFYQTRSNAIILHDTLPANCISKMVVIKSDEIFLPEGLCVISTNTEKFLQTQLDVWYRLWCRWKQRRSPTNPTRMWARVHKGNWETYYVRSRHSKSRKSWWVTLSKYSETRLWVRIYKALRFDTYTCWKRSNKYGETRIGRLQRGARNWLRSSRIDKENAFFF